MEYKLYNGKEIITFDEQKHRYYDSKGNWLPGVTTITGIIDKSGALMGWAIKMMGLYLLDQQKKGNDRITEEIIDTAKREYRRIKRDAADIGKEIHEWVSEWIKGNKPEMPSNEKVINGITAFLRFQKENKVKWVETERAVYSKKHKYAGTLDAIGEIGGQLTLIDFKSSSGIYDEMRFQVAGYQIAYEEETGKKIQRAMILKFGKETGDFEVKELENIEEDKKAFLACLQINKRLRELKQYA